MPDSVVGIDLGATHSCVGVWRNGEVEIVQYEKDKRLVPSYVSFSNPPVVGDAAKARAGKNTLLYSKCLIGRKFGSREEVNLHVHEELPCDVVLNDAGEPFYKLDSGELISPTVVSSKIIEELKRIAQTRLEQTVNEAVITVPASFLDAQRVATIQAGELAGFSKVHLINEPTASAIAYGLEENINGEIILVFDLGAATLDVSLLTIQDRDFRVLDTAGVSGLGGIYFDREVVDYATEELRKKGRQLDETAKNRLRLACAETKKVLGSAPQASIKFDGIQIPLTRAKFNDLNEKHFARIVPTIATVLKRASVDKSKVKHIVPVGGSSRIPRVVELVSTFFDGRRPNMSSVNPDEAIAYGATVKGALLSGHFTQNEPMLVIIEIASRALGIETVGGVMSTIITRKTTVPTKKTNMFTTASDNQESVTISVYEGEQPYVKDNHQLGQFELSEIPRAPRHVPQIEVTFELDTSGTLDVTAVEKKGGKSRSKQLAVTMV